MCDFKDYKKFVDWMDIVLVDWIKDNARKYESFQDMVDDIDAIPLGFDIVNDGYKSAFESFVRAARTSEDAWNIMKETLLEYGKIDFGLIVDRLYRQFLLHYISEDIEGCERIWNKYHG